jgi:rod shape-determining protein MreD
VAAAVVNSRLFFIRLPLLLITVVVLQHSGVGGLSISGIHPDIIVGLVCATGIVAGREKGALIGFLAGILADSFLVTPYGLSALIYTVVGYLSGELERFELADSRIVSYLAVGAMSGVGVVLFYGTEFVLGIHNPLSHQLLAEVSVVSLLNVVISPILVFAARFSLKPNGVDSRFESRR